jgi:hypothetical protein
MEYRRIATFNQGTPQEIVWDIYVDYETAQSQYIAEAHCLTRTEPCWVVTGYATPALALTSMNNHIVNYIKLIPNAVFQVVCNPDNPITLNVTCLAKSFDIHVVSGTASPQSGTGTNYANTVLKMWNAIMTY